MQVLIIGDIIIDRYIHGTTTRLNPEAPVPVVNVTKEYDTYGGASLVFKNLESLGWVGFDVSNGVSPDTKYVRIAQGRDYKDVAPVKGTIFGGLEELMSVNLIVQQQ